MSSSTAAAASPREVSVEAPTVLPMMRPLPLRAEQPTDNATVVLRAGLMSRESFRRSAERTFDAYGVYGISVEGVIDSSVQEVCRSTRIIGYRQIRLSSFGRLRGAGFAVLATFDHPHFT